MTLYFFKPSTNVMLFVGTTFHIKCLFNLNYFIFEESKLLYIFIVIFIVDGRKECNIIKVMLVTKKSNVVKKIEINLI